MVGKSGRPSLWCCASRRSVKRLCAAGVGVGHLREPLAHLGLRVRGELRAVLERLAVGVELRADRRRSPSFSPRSERATSSSFWTANDIQLRTSSSRRGSLRLSIGECSSEHEVETTMSLAGGPRSSSQQVEAALEVVDPHVPAGHDAREQRLVLRPAVLARSARGCARRARSRAPIAGDRQPRQHRVGLADVVEVGVRRGSSARPRLRRAAGRRARAPPAPPACGPRPAPARRSGPIRRRACPSSASTSAYTSTSESSSSRRSNSSPAHLPSSRKVSGPTRTGLVSIPSSFASAYCVERLARGEARTSCRARARGRCSGSWCRTTSSSPSRSRRRRRPGGRAPSRSRCRGRRRSAVPAVALRHSADERDRVEHLVVEREVVGRDQVDPGLALQLPVRRRAAPRPSGQVVSERSPDQKASVADLSSAGRRCAGNRSTLESACGKRTSWQRRCWAARRPPRARAHERAVYRAGRVQSLPKSAVHGSHRPVRGWRRSHPPRAPKDATLEARATALRR